MDGGLTPALVVAFYEPTVVDVVDAVVLDDVVVGGEPSSRLYIATATRTPPEKFGYTTSAGVPEGWPLR